MLHGLRRREFFVAATCALDGFAVAQAMGLRLSEEVSVAGFDGTDVARFALPALTPVLYAPLARGGAAAGTLLQLIADGYPEMSSFPRLRIAQPAAPAPEAEPTPPTVLCNTR